VRSVRPATAAPSDITCAPRAGEAVARELRMEDGTQRVRSRLVRLVRGEGRGVSTWYKGGTRLVRLVRGRGGGAGLQGEADQNSRLLVARRQAPADFVLSEHDDERREAPEGREHGYIEVLQRDDARDAVHPPAGGHREQPPRHLEIKVREAEALRLDKLRRHHAAVTRCAARSGSGAAGWRAGAP
jgi:hypothetical protein